jgi:ABC-type bacteriocin/lantibiotic exporter with double-glycine peptidase domain
MSKRKKELKEKRSALEQARKFTPGKVIRLVLKSLVFAVAVAIIMIGIELLGIPAFSNFWIQLAVMVVIYLIAFPFLMSEFRPKHYLKKDK